jgi:hypothetical protein
MKKFSLAVLLALPIIGAQAEVQSSGWRDISSPDIVSSAYTHKFSSMPQESMLGHDGRNWSDDFWPSQKGSINRRWNAPGQPGFKLKSPSRESAMQLSARQLEQLAPTEKFDLLQGNYSYPTVKMVTGSSSENAKDWAGICNGWAPASSLLVEPKPVALRNPDGILIPFGSSDIKGLLSYYYAFYADDEPTRQVGLRCYLKRGLRALSRGCNDDLNAGAFHIIIANRLGLEKKGMMMDRDRLNEIWNQPVIGYQTNITNRSGNKLTVETKLYYVEEIQPTWEAVVGTDKQKLGLLELEYELELNSSGNIIGGNWISWTRPDFLWFKDKAIEFTGEFAGLKTLYEASLK